MTLSDMILGCMYVVIGVWTALILNPFRCVDRWVDGLIQKLSDKLNEWDS